MTTTHVVSNPDAIDLADRNLFMAEASVLRLAPGEWPDVIEVPDPDFPKTFVRCEGTHHWSPDMSEEASNRLGTHVDPFGDVVAVDYATTSASDFLRVWND
jgi:hypothetical protein